MPDGMPEPKKNNEIENNGCEIAYNRFSLHYSRKTQKPKKYNRKNISGWGNSFLLLLQPKPTDFGFFGCEFYPFYNRTVNS